MTNNSVPIDQDGNIPVSMVLISFWGSHNWHGLSHSDVYQHLKKSIQLVSTKFAKECLPVTIEVSRIISNGNVQPIDTTHFVRVYVNPEQITAATLMGFDVSDPDGNARLNLAINNILVNLPSDPCLKSPPQRIQTQTGSGKGWQSALGHRAFIISTHQYTKLQFASTWGGKEGPMVWVTKRMDLTNVERLIVARSGDIIFLNQDVYTESSNHE